MQNELCHNFQSILFCKSTAVVVGWLHNKTGRVQPRVICFYIPLMQEALDYYKKAVSLPWDRKALEGCHEKEFFRSEEGLPVKAVLRRDIFHLNGRKIQIRRVYLQFNFIRMYHPKRGGWVLDSDVPICMICHTFFTFFSRKHHCRLCGNIVCSYCSDSEVAIKDCPEVGRVRVCSNCYYFQVRRRQSGFFMLPFTPDRFYLCILFVNKNMLFVLILSYIICVIMCLYLSLNINIFDLATCAHLFVFVLQEEATLLLDSKRDLSYGFKNFEILHTRLSFQCLTSKALSHNCCVPSTEEEEEQEDEQQEEDMDLLLGSSDTVTQT